ncbi:MAG: hypothetical protein JWO72_547 [Caulobacteraceae bacterium]|nr:hypothetical protein [Caulobacteraceae bacterium]
MSTRAHDQAELEKRLWKEIGKARYGMLGVVGCVPAHHFQPMAAFCEPENDQIWFFSRNDTDLAGMVEQGADAMFMIQAKDQDFQACVHGRLAQRPDRARMDRYWNAVVSAWCPEGKDDARMTLLRLDVSDAQVWLSEANPLAFAFQIGKANLTHREPNLGESRVLDIGTPT